MPNNQETNTEVQQESVQQFDLSDVSVLTELFEVVLYDVVRRPQVTHGESNSHACGTA